MTIKPEVEKNENIIDKWLFNDKSDVLMFYEECKTVYNSCKELVIKLKKILVQTKENTEEESISLVVCLLLWLIIKIIIINMININLINNTIVIYNALQFLNAWRWSITT